MVLDWTLMKDFNLTIANENRTRMLLEGSCLYHANYATWKKVRLPITSVLNKKGTLLDIGCANGFLTRCLVEWSLYKIVPYGIDRDQNLIRWASKIHKEHSNNFKSLSIFDLHERQSHGLPNRFDYIYWAVWDNWNITSQENVNILLEIWDAINLEGKLILGFYEKEPNQIIKNANQFGHYLLLQPNIIQSNPLQYIWFKKKSKL
jgi:2-polyprenyl-3-methyl-5-hydroxy-6-metoxy-1,4-benzoquinol methylase